LVELQRRRDTAYEYTITGGFRKVPHEMPAEKNYESFFFSAEALAPLLRYAI
jgi:hypothetical protein